jgi:hypothetical protein
MWLGFCCCLFLWYLVFFVLVINICRLLCWDSEFVVLVLYFSVYFYLCSFNYSLFFVFFSVCESFLSLSILVSIVRSHGSDYFQSSSMLKFLCFLFFYHFLPFSAFCWIVCSLLFLFLLFIFLYSFCIFLFFTLLFFVSFLFIFSFIVFLSFLFFFIVFVSFLFYLYCFCFFCLFIFPLLFLFILFFFIDFLFLLFIFVYCF